MSEVEIKFERENLEGIVAVGTYLRDAAKRFGIRFEDVCDVDAGIHFCQVMVTTGGDLLSTDTKAESEYFESNPRKTGERLACQAKIERPGEIVVMTGEKTTTTAATEESAEDRTEQFKKEFAELPLEKKISHLVQLETITLGETISFIMNSPFKVADKLMDVMAEYGFKKEEQQKEAVKPEEHRAAESTNGSEKTDSNVDSKTDSKIEDAA